MGPSGLSEMVASSRAFILKPLPPTTYITEILATQTDVKLRHIITSRDLAADQSLAAIRQRHSS